MKYKFSNILFLVCAVYASNSTVGQKPFELKEIHDIISDTLASYNGSSCYLFNKKNMNGSKVWSKIYENGRLVQSQVTKGNFQTEYTYQYDDSTSNRLIGIYRKKKDLTDSIAIYWSEGKISHTIGDVCTYYEYDSLDRLISVKIGNLDDWTLTKKIVYTDNVKSIYEHEFSESVPISSWYFDDLGRVSMIIYPVHPDDNENEHLFLKDESYSPDSLIIKYTENIDTTYALVDGDYITYMITERIKNGICRKYFFNGKHSYSERDCFANNLITGRNTYGRRGQLLSRKEYRYDR